MAEIKGEKHDLQILIVAAFRYGVRRHSTQALMSYQNVLLDNIKMLDGWQIQQFVDEIEFEQRRLHAVDTDYLTPLLNLLQKELEARGQHES